MRETVGGRGLADDGFWFVCNGVAGGVLLALLGAGGFLKRMGQALIGEFLASGDEALFVGALGRENGDYVVFGVGLVALLTLAPACRSRNEREDKPADIFPP